MFAATSKQFSTIRLMADEQSPPQPEIEFKTEPPKENRTPGPAIIIGFVFMAVVVGLFILVSHKPQKPSTHVPSAYAVHIQLQDVKLSQAENFVGGAVNYIESQLANTGDKNLNRASVGASFNASI